MEFELCSYGVNVRGRWLDHTPRRISRDRVTSSMGGKVQPFDLRTRRTEGETVRKCRIGSGTEQPSNGGLRESSSKRREVEETVSSVVVKSWVDDF